MPFFAQVQPLALTDLIVFIAAYIVGSTPFGFLAGKFRGIDIREHGSGNIGATNVLRTLGKPLGIGVFVLDFFKGLAPRAGHQLPFPGAIADPHFRGPGHDPWAQFHILAGL